jgi:alkyl hydroperoxide reductase subunit AhpC
MDKLNLDFENGFWIPVNWHENDASYIMWQNFRNYCRDKGEFNEIVLLTEFNAKAQRYAGDEEDGDDDQWFVQFKTPEDYTFFVMRFAG